MCSWFCNGRRAFFPAVKWTVDSRDLCCVQHNMDVCQGSFPLSELQVTDRKCWTLYPIRFNCDNNVFGVCVCFPWWLFRMHTERVAGVFSRQVMKVTITVVTFAVFSSSFTRQPVVMSTRWRNVTFMSSFINLYCPLLAHLPHKDDDLVTFTSAATIIFNVHKNS